MSTARWRLRAWLPDREKVVLEKHWSTNCKLCAAAKCVDMATEMAARNQRSFDAMKWTVEKLTGVVGEWDIVFHDGNRIGPWIRRHGH